MTEKDFRQIVTDLEIDSSYKDNIKEFMNKLVSIIDTSDLYKVESIDKAGSLKTGTHSKESNNFDFTVILRDLKSNYYPIMNQACLNEIWNKLVFGFNIEKVNQIKIDEQRNAIIFTKDNKNITIFVRFLNDLEFQLGNFTKEDKIRYNFFNNARADFNLFKNTIILIKDIRDKAYVNISGYVIELLLYYALSANFTKHTYEAYLHEFIHGIDDFLKGKKIDQYNDTYHKLNIERVQQPNKPYTIVDIANGVNLTANIGEAYLSEFKKLKKAISKALEIR